ncbi:uncharacterized protein [Setaria viridis]|uniref:RBR-type E3 ubiquitin transferase n=2 Tax=Setaria viridis TaxID=4556 RepID=A0A4U6VTE6_SETVI|nr:uncharacterized protein LOC117842574 isoform X1 [Setaria viridis]TKW33171.1 hypothetical protein SEVIR_2G215400v2 [Setaria viridis]
MPSNLLILLIQRTTLTPWISLEQGPLLAVHSLQLRAAPTTTMLDLIYKFARDLVLAEDPQAEEVLRFSTHPERFCAVCKLVIPSLEASWKPDDCDHVICISCLWQYAPETEATGLPRCAVASCESLHKSETHQGVGVNRSTMISTKEMDSGKGKEPLDVMIQEVGQCSRGANVMASSEFYCTICMETVHVREVFPIPGCTHLFCVSCLRQYIMVKVEDNVLSIGCPEPGCKDGTLDPEACQDVIPPQLFQRWGAALCDLALGAFKFHCPFKDCLALLVDERGPREAAIRKAECPHCSRMFCVQCKVAWHHEVTCEDFQSFGTDEPRQDDLLLRKVTQESMAQPDPVGSCESLHKSETHQGINVGPTTLISIKDMDSYKGKKQFDAMLQELGQCSRGANVMADSEFYCTICMETVHIRDLFPISGCTHLFCVNCMNHYITAKVEHTALPIGCPEPGCKDGLLDPEACRDMIPLELFQRWGTALCDSALGAFKLYCPFKDCSALLVDECGSRKAAIRKAECPHCSRMFCAQCKVAWHYRVTCEDFQRLRNDEQVRDDLLLRKVVQESKWQRCLRRVVTTCQSLCKSKVHRGIDLGHSTLISTEDMDSCKGKDPLYDMLQDLGQCSPGSNAMASYEFYCTICMEAVHVGELFPISGCTHLFCVSCVSQYITAKVEDNVLSISCPDPGCKYGALDPETCRDVIPPQLFQRWGAALCDSALGSFKFYCPFNDCSALLVHERGHGEGEAAITNAECPHCRRMFCAQCKVAWHDGITCAEFQRLGKDERGKNDLLLRKVARESRWQRCPKCKMYVERAEGCVYIVCRCQHRFCYLCASPMSNGIHRCSRCKRTW